MNFWLEHDGSYVVPSFKYIKNNDPASRHIRRKPVRVTGYLGRNPIDEIGVRLCLLDEVKTPLSKEYFYDILWE
tara:strand:+ start:4420 stop:4641 length:222 start_codon:yes stop_codon:yes gene_type:complete